MEKFNKFNIILENGEKVACSSPSTNEIKRKNIIEFNNVCNEIFKDKQKYGHLFMTNEQFEQLKNNPKKMEQLKITII